MGIIIKGMDMPKGEFLLELITHYEGGEKKDIKFVHKKDIIEIPTPHGKLIDADAIKNVFDKGDTFTAFHFIEAVSEAPTILEAEE